MSCLSTVFLENIFLNDRNFITNMKVFPRKTLECLDSLKQFLTVDKRLIGKETGCDYMLFLENKCLKVLLNICKLSCRYTIIQESSLIIVI